MGVILTTYQLGWSDPSIWTICPYQVGFLVFPQLLVVISTNLWNQQTTQQKSLTSVLHRFLFLVCHIPASFQNPPSRQNKSWLTHGFLTTEPNWDDPPITPSPTFPHRFWNRPFSPANGSLARCNAPWHRRNPRPETYPYHPCMVYLPTFGCF